MSEVVIILNGKSKRVPFLDCNMAEVAFAVAKVTAEFEIAGRIGVYVRMSDGTLQIVASSRRDLCGNY